MRTRFECLAIRGMKTLREEDGKVDEEFNQRARGRAWRKRALKHCSLVGASVTLGCGQRLVREKNFTGFTLGCRCGGKVNRVHV